MDPWKLLCFVLWFSMKYNGSDAVLFENEGPVSSDREASLHGEESEEELNGSYRLEILPELPAAGFQLTKTVSDNLALTCRAVKESGPFVKFKLEWHVPMAWVPHANSRISMHKPDKGGSLMLVVKNLQETDSGTYHCLAHSEGKTLLNHSVEVEVKPRKGLCGEGRFQCSSGACIPRRYLCDGFDDCPDASDEAVHICGADSCDGKLRCADGRCIHRRICCDRHKDPSCNISIEIPCCVENLSALKNIDLTLHSQQLSDIGFLQSTMYTIIGCAVAFVLIITLTVMAICRVHMRRSSMGAPYSSYGASRRTWNDLDSYLAANSRWNRRLYSSRPRGVSLTLNDERVDINDPASNTLLVTYNINNGVQLLTQPVNPPPYEAIAQAPLQREEPPPPYSSHENLPTAAAGRNPPLWNTLGQYSPLSALVALLSGGSSNEERAAATRNAQLDENSHNNNGDINGNSTNIVRVQPNSNPAATIATIHNPAPPQP